MDDFLNTEHMIERIRLMRGDLNEQKIQEYTEKLIKHIDQNGVDTPVINFLNLLNKGVGRKHLISNVQAHVIKQGDLDNVGCFAFVEGAALADITDIILNSNNSVHIYEFALVIECLSIDNKKLEATLIGKIVDKLIEQKDATHLYLLASESEIVDVKKIEKALIEIGNIRVLELFATNVDGAHVSKIKKAIEKIGGYTPVIVKESPKVNTTSRLETF